MAGEWKDCLLGDVIELKRGYDLPQKERLPGTVPLISSSGVTDTHATAMVKGPGVVTGRYGTLGQVFYIEQDFWPLNTTLYVRNFKGNDPRFISYFLRNIDFLAYSDKAAVPGLNRNHLHKARVRIPADVVEQRAIAHILGTLDDKIELNRKQNETLEAMARALFKAWFVDFEPVRAKMEGRWQRGQSLPGLPAHLYDLFPDRLVESELGEIPEGWETKRVSDYLSLAYGKSLPARKRQKGIYPVYGSGGLVGFHNEAMINGPTVIVGRKGTVGSLYWEDRPCFPIDTVFYVQPKVPLSFCYYLLKSLPLKDMNTDAAVLGLNRENVYRLEVAAPPRELVSHFAETTSRFRESIAVISKSSEALSQLRDTILPKLISGELRVSKLDI
ncbi:restriction endonuclease subunit S [Caldimonas thermodepolymerans]|uniref:Type I restriction enzyme S subunit n=1 Tax=Caldimonas thermodepolymerans TaxID=215580 RepID=A0AA46DGJ9_9BURK|nr:restriction endonuclease subunit S [Caldimonas thermodepolymerans]TCP09089.1 type I restriction enzyme S subunit [Caldimonas thermodepolymerans]UZG47382.1 restriction endonuclease subunit S [Caldimonas thermodepolymerans]